MSAAGWRARLGRLLPASPPSSAAPAKPALPPPKAKPPEPPKAPTAPKAAPPPKAAAPPKPAGPPRHVAVTVLGLSGEALEQVIGIAEAECAAKALKPVFVTDGRDFAPFRRRRLIADQVVDAEARLASAPDLAWRLYRRRQYALIAARWRPAAVISFGRRPDEDCLEVLGGGGGRAS